MPTIDQLNSMPSIGDDDLIPVFSVSNGATRKAPLSMVAEYVFAQSNSNYINVKDVPYNAKGDGVASDAIAIQSAIDAASAAGGGVVVLPDGEYLLGASQSSEVFDNYGSPFAASGLALILRKNVSLVGTGSARCRLKAVSPTLTIIGAVSIENATISGLALDGGWTVGAAGAGHGVFTFASNGGADAVCRNLTVRDVSIQNVASYGIGLQCGIPQGVTLDNIRIENIGADGLDLKARSLTDSVNDALGNKVSNVHVKNHGQRVIGSSGVDVRGVWTIDNVQVTDFGAVEGMAQVGIRFRTKSPDGDGNRIGSKSSLSNFYVRPRIGASGVGINGIESGSDDVHVANGTIEGCANGVSANGNAVGGALNNTYINITAVNCTEYGFFVSTSASDTSFIGCNSVGAGIAGFRNTGPNSRFIGCRSIGDAASLSAGGLGDATQTVVSCSFGIESGISVSSAVAGRVNVEPKGATSDIELRLQGKGTSSVAAYVNGARAFDATNPASAVNWVQTRGGAATNSVSVSAQGSDANIDLVLTAKGTGAVRFGTHSTNADAAITGYITIKDAGGTVRKLAVIN